MDRLMSMEVFTKVVEMRSFIAASEALGISRPMASKHIQALETNLGVRLLNRTTRKISLTEAGSAFILRCQTVLSEIDEAIAEAANMQVEPKGLLRINAPLTFARSYLARSIADFQAQYPQISIDLTLNDRVVDIVDEGFDLAIRIGVLADSSLIARKLAPCRVVLCAAPAYLEANGIPNHPTALANHNCLLYAYFDQEKVWTFADPDGELAIRVDGDFRTNFGEVLVEAAVAGRGIVLEPSFTVAPYIASGELVPLLQHFNPRELGIYAVYPPGRTLPQKARAFIDHLSRAFGPEPYWDKGLALAPRR